MNLSKVKSETVSDIFIDLLLSDFLLIYNNLLLS